VIAEYLLKNSALNKCLMTMSAKLRKSAMTLAIATILFNLALLNMKVVYSNSTCGKIDLFTQKVPFNGKGINESSDAFQPQELVVLYALVTYNEDPIVNKLVAFQVNNPTNALQNITVMGVSSTNKSGIAQFSFRIPWPSDDAEQIIFGEWFAIATVEIAEQVLADTLTFPVGWIIKITNMKTLNENLEPQTRYLRGEVVFLNLTIENIALTLKLATIIIDVYDVMCYPIIHLEVENMVIQPSENNLLASSKIPITASIGEATISAMSYTAPPKIGGVPYSPATLSTFEIVTSPVKQYYLTVRTNPFGVVLISGEGWYNEGTTVPLTAPEYVLILPGIRYRFSYWDVKETPKPGNPLTVTMDANYTVTAHYILQYYLTVISPYGIPSGEGWYDNGTIAYATLNIGIVDHGNGTRSLFTSWNCDASGTNYAQSNPILMESPKNAVANWKTQYRLTVRTDPPEITTIPGEGWYNQGENVTLTALSVEGYDFGYWDVDGVSKGKGVNITSVYMDSPHAATAHYSLRVEGWFVPYWFYWLLLLLLVVLLAIWLYRRRRKKAEEAFYSGWTAWYYCHDLRGKVRKFRA
jgi:hypothetical protein